ncbi:MAG: hypothetical protein ACD_63C00260G0004 [uncultured bacterium]|nr:MAG: hypothetical protein ACD_63C00260G0004 [uncultured bacterium]
MVVDSSDSPENIRGYISFIAAEEFGRPQALILLDRGGKNITVQESDWAQKLFDRFGGYTFGTGRNWGYLNEEGKDKVGVEGVEKFLSHHVGAHSRAPIASGN